MGNSAAARVMVADFLMVMNRVLFLEMPVNLSHHEHPACSAGNPNSLSVSVILLFQTFLHPPAGAGTSPGVSRWWELRLLLTHTESLSVQPCCFFCFFIPDVPPIVWWVSGWGGGDGDGGGGGLAKHNSSHSFKHWYIFIKTSTLLIFFLTFFCKNGGVNQYKICMVVWETVSSLHKRKKPNQTKQTIRETIQRLKTTISA